MKVAINFGVDYDLDKVTSIRKIYGTHILPDGTLMPESEIVIEGIKITDPYMGFGDLELDSKIIEFEVRFSFKDGYSISQREIKTNSSVLEGLGFPVNAYFNEIATVNVQDLTQILLMHKKKVVFYHKVVIHGIEDPEIIHQYEIEATYTLNNPVRHGNATQILFSTFPQYLERVRVPDRRGIATFTLLSIEEIAETYGLTAENIATHFCFKKK